MSDSSIRSTTIPWLTLLFLASACFEADVTRQPRDRESIPPPSYEWSPERGERWEFPLPPTARWQPDRQAKLEAELRRAAPPDRTLVVAVYELDGTLAEAEEFYRRHYIQPPEVNEKAIRFAPERLLPEARLFGEHPVHIELVKWVEDPAPRSAAVPR